VSQTELRLERMLAADLPALESLTEVDRLFLTRTSIADISALAQ
jgi:hypothetical protein